MLLDQFKKITELDSQINDLHRQLAELYKERSLIVGSEQGPVSVKTAINQQSTKWHFRKLRPTVSVNNHERN